MTLLDHNPRSGHLGEQQRKMIKTISDDTRDQSANNLTRMEGLADSCVLYQACRTSDEIFRITKDVFRRAFPNLSGGLSLISEARDTLETVVTWGEIQSKANHFDASQCWALRRGRPHRVETHSAEDPVSCDHYHADSAEWHHCLPLMASGETLGVLYLCGADDVGDGALPQPLGMKRAPLRMSWKVCRWPSPTSAI